VSAVVFEPPEHTHPASTRQVIEHPSLLDVLASSHFSSPASKPSPHVVIQFTGLVELSWAYPSSHFWQVSAEVVEPPEHTHPASTSQVDEHPSLIAMLASSHFSVPASKPSPQVVTQFSGLVELSWTYPAVHCVQVSAVVVEPPEQTQPASTSQVDEHPSLLAVLVSSHFSSPASLPSPQVVTQFSGLVELS
jgi:hypothetical protein